MHVTSQLSGMRSEYIDIPFQHFLLLFIIKFVFTIFISFFDLVRNFRNRILANQKQELVITNCRLNCMLWLLLTKAIFCSQKGSKSLIHYKLHLVFVSMISLGISVLEFVQLTVAVKLLSSQRHHRKYFFIKTSNARIISTIFRK